MPSSLDTYRLTGKHLSPKDQAVLDHLREDKKKHPTQYTWITPEEKLEQLIIEERETARFKEVINDLRKTIKHTIDPLS